MPHSTKLNILWFSDIHFHKMYEPENLFEFNSQFRAKIDSLLYVGKKIDYIFIGGDIAQSGDVSDYEKFHLIVMEPLLKNFYELNKTHSIELPQIIVIPGNHDVKYAMSSFANKYISEFKIESGKKGNVYNFFNLKTPEFKKLFADFSKYIDKLKFDYPKFFMYNATVDDRQYIYYNVDNLFGYLIDKVKKVIFVLINSAWFSFGENLLKFLTANIILDPSFIDKIEKIALLCKSKSFKDELVKLIASDEITIDVLNKLLRAEKIEDVKALDYTEMMDLFKFFYLKLKVTEDIAEYNSQITGIHLFEDSKILTDLEKYNDYVIVLGSHHPINWLRWEELYSTDIETMHISKFFHELLNKVDIMLTGHEHIPYIYFSANDRFKNIISLKTGPFLKFKKAEDEAFKFNDSWFTSLSIDTEKYNVRTRKFIFEMPYLDSATLQCTMLPESNVIDFGRHRHNYLTDSRKNEYLELIRSNQMMAMLKKGILGNINPFKILVHTEKNNFYYCNVLMKIDTDSEENCHIFFAKGENFYNKINTRATYKFIDSLSLVGSVRLIFIVLDICIEEQVMVKYQDKSISRKAAYNFAVNFGDILFNRFRHDFFIRLEPKSEDDNHYASVNYSNLKFINKIVSYWELEDFTN